MEEEEEKEKIMEEDRMQEEFKGKNAGEEKKERKEYNVGINRQFLTYSKNY